MPNINNYYPVKRKILPLVFMIDVSGSMAGERMGSIISALEILMMRLSVLNDKCFAYEVRCAVLTFSTGARWLTPNRFKTPAEIDFDKLHVGGLTWYGGAFEQLDLKMNEDAFLNQEIGYLVPTIVFISDGDSVGDWTKIKNTVYEKNHWIGKSKKLAIAIGEDIWVPGLLEIVHNYNQIIQICNNELFEDLIISLVENLMMEYKLNCYTPSIIDCSSIVNNSIENLNCAIKQSNGIICIT